MKPIAFAYVRPRSLDEALGHLDAAGEARILAGGQSLVPLLNMRLVRPTILVDINGLPGLDTIEGAPDGGLSIGALVRHTDLMASSLVRERAPLLVAAAAHIGHRAIRNRGTIGGSLAHADPAAELPAAVIALDGMLSVVSPKGRRRIPAAAFALGPLTSALEPCEILTGVELPGPARRAWGFGELARRAGDFALAGIAGALRPDPRDPGRCAAGCLVAFGVGDTPLRLSPAEALLSGARIDAALARAAGEAAAATCTPRQDLHATEAYRRHLAGVLTEQVILDAARRLRAG